MQGRVERRRDGRGSLQHLNAMVVAVAHDNVPVTIDGNSAKRNYEMAIVTTMPPDGADMRAISIIHHLHAIVPEFNHNQKSGTINAKP